MDLDWKQNRRAKGAALKKEMPYPKTIRTIKARYISRGIWDGGLGQMNFRALIAFLSLASLCHSKEIKDERYLVDEIGLEGNIGLPYVLGLGAAFSLKLREVPVYPSLALKVGIGAITKIDFLFGINYRNEENISYSFNFGPSSGEETSFDSHGGPPKKFVGAAANVQRRKYIGESKYWRIFQSLGVDYKRRFDGLRETEYTLYPYFEAGIVFMAI